MKSRRFQSGCATDVLPISVVMSGSSPDGLQATMAAGGLFTPPPASGPVPGCLPSPRSRQAAKVAVPQALGLTGQYAQLP